MSGRPARLRRRVRWGAEARRLPVIPVSGWTGIATLRAERPRGGFGVGLSVPGRLPAFAAPGKRQLGWLVANVLIHPLFENDLQRSACQRIL